MDMPLHWGYTETDMRMTITTLLVVLGALLAGCATSPTSRADARPRGLETARVTYDPPADANLGTVVRALGEQAGGGLVLMQGLEWYDPPSRSFKNAPLAEVASQLAALFDGKVQELPEYYFIYPQGYEMLEQVSLGGQLAPRFDAMRAAIAFGAGTNLYNVFAILSRTLDTTIIADNAIADAECGEMALPEIALSTVLEAVLKSARIPNELIEVVSAGDFVFIRSRSIPQRDATLLNEAELSGEDRALLDQRVTVELPFRQAAGATFQLQSGAFPLKDVLPSLSRQLGIELRAEPALAQLPVNAAVFTDVPVRTLMDLLVRQWLMPHYGYTVTDGRIVIRAVDPP
jgi:hypothetical protein